MEFDLPKNISTDLYDKLYRVLGWKWNASTTTTSSTTTTASTTKIPDTATTESTNFLIGTTTVFPYPESNYERAWRRWREVEDFLRKNRDVVEKMGDDVEGMVRMVDADKERREREERWRKKDEF